VQRRRLLLLLLQQKQALPGEFGEPRRWLLRGHPGPLPGHEAVVVVAGELAAREVAEDGGVVADPGQRGRAVLEEVGG
jgi:hypothetical protein